MSENLVSELPDDLVLSSADQGLNCTAFVLDCSNQLTPLTNRMGINRMNLSSAAVSKADSRHFLYPPTPGPVASRSLSWCLASTDSCGILNLSGLPNLTDTQGDMFYLRATGDGHTGFGLVCGGNRGLDQQYPAPDLLLLPKFSLTAYFHDFRIWQKRAKTRFGCKRKASESLRNGRISGTDITGWCPGPLDRAVHNLLIRPCSLQMSAISQVPTKIFINEKQISSCLGRLSLDNNNLDSHPDLEEEPWFQMDVVPRRSQSELNFSSLLDRVNTNQNSKLVLYRGLQLGLRRRSVLPSLVQDEIKKPLMQVVLWKPPEGAVNSIFEKLGASRSEEHSFNFGRAAAATQCIFNTSVHLPNRVESISCTVQMAVESGVIMKDGQNMDTEDL